MEKEKSSYLSLDKTDISILRLLEQDAKQTMKELSAKLNLSQTPIYERIKRLEKGNFIERYTALLNKKKLGKSLTAFCHVSLKEHAKEYINQFESEVLHINEVKECYHLSGMHDYLLKVIVYDMDEYQHFIVDKLAKLDNIGKVESTIVMKELKFTTSILLK